MHSEQMNSILDELSYTCKCVARSIASKSEWVARCKCLMVC